MNHEKQPRLQFGVVLVHLVRLVHRFATVIHYVLPTLVHSVHGTFAKDDLPTGAAEFPLGLVIFASLQSLIDEGRRGFGG